MTTLDPNGRESVKRALKTVAAALLGPYRCNRIYRLTSMPVEPTMPPGISCHRLEAPSAAAADIDPELRERFSYDHDDAYGYGLSRDGCLAAVCWFWVPRRFNEPLIWVLRTNEAILVDLVTASRYRGQGLAPLLIRYASAEMRRMGWDPLYTWMWHTHSASYRAFEKAGWTQIAWVLEIRPLGMARTFRLCWRSFRNRSRASPHNPPLAGVR
jgi:GNAT superfamily N-acetyltransferase